MTQVLRFIIQMLLIADLVFLFVLFNQNFKLKTSIAVISEKIEKIIGTKYTVTSNPLLIPISHLKESDDKDIQKVIKKILLLRLLFIVTFIIFIILCLLISNIGKGSV